MKRRIYGIALGLFMATAAIVATPGPASANHDPDPLGPFTWGCPWEPAGLPGSGVFASSATYPLFEDQRIYRCFSIPGGQGGYRWELAEVCPEGTQADVIFGPVIYIPGSNWYFTETACEPIGG